jgi:dTDP-4-amino-4,6-dideoxygalactose transaminase
MGPETQAFESELGAFFGLPGVVTVCTGTSALHLALEALGLGSGDEVLVPSLTFVASFQAVSMSGARPVACDVLLDSGLIDLEDAARRITPKTRALMPVHYAGYAGDIDGVHRFARERGLRVIEDAAHAFGSQSCGRLIGTFGDVVCFSFDPIKSVTCGQGGAIVTSDLAVAEEARCRRNLAIERLPGRRADSIDVRRVGWRYALSDINAAIGRVQLSRFDGELKPRRLALVAHYRERLVSQIGVHLLRSDPAVVPHMFPILIADGQRDAVQEALALAGYEALVHYRPNHLLSAFHGGSPCPVAEGLYDELLTLPLHMDVTHVDIDVIVSVIARTLGYR